MTILRTLLVVAAAQAAAFADSAKNPVATQPEPASTSFADAGSLSEYFFGKDNAWDTFYDDVQQWKKDHHLPIGISADHWWHVDRGGYLYGNGYGVPGEGGTYRYSLTFDPALKLSGDGFVNEVGIHFLGRIRDSSDKLRAFYKDTAWTTEAYAYAKTDLGTFKAGQMFENFCIGWDNSWYEGVSYFDEFRANPSWGVAWDNTWKVSDAFSVDTSAQYYIRSDYVSGALVNSSAATTKGLIERNSFIVRAVPTWQLDKDTKLAWGVAGLTREVDGSEKYPGLVDDRQTAWETDLTLSWKKWTVWGQYIDSHGATSPTRYVSGGPSDRQNSLSTGINYKLGPISTHVNFSKSWDHKPDGHQYIFEPGITFQLAKNLTLYTEYVKWNVTGSNGDTAKYDDGFELALVWNF